MLWRCDCKAESVRWEDGGRGEIRVRAPEEVVRRRLWVVEEEEGGRRVRDVGK